MEREDEGSETIGRPDQFLLRHDIEGDFMACDHCAAKVPTTWTNQKMPINPRETRQCLICEVCHHTHLPMSYFYYHRAASLEDVCSGLAWGINRILSELRASAIPQLVELHDFEDGQPIGLDFRTVTMIQPLAAHPGDDDSEPIAARVRIDTSRQTLLVRETWDEIKALTAPK